MKRAVVLLSGGLDSTTLLYFVKKKGFKAHCLIFDYGQRHKKEINTARNIARVAKCSCEVVKFSLPWKGSSLLDKTQKLPKRKKIDPKEIPTTYVPARNIIFLSFAVSYAETIGASAVFIGANAIDYSGYPDCRPEFYQAYQRAVDVGMKSGVQGKTIKVYSPLVKKTKAEIIRLGIKLKVSYHLTWSCYAGGRRPCGQCDSCLLRRKGFEVTGVRDPLT